MNLFPEEKTMLSDPGVTEAGNSDLIRPAASEFVKPPMQSIYSRFDSLNNQNVKYVLLEGYRELPNKLTDETALMLFEPFERFAGSSVPLTQGQIHDYVGRDQIIVHTLGLQPIGSRHDLTYLMSDGKRTQKIVLIPKGYGFMPGLFESRLIKNRYGHNKVVPIPTDDVLVPAMMYHRIQHLGWLKDDPIMKEKLVTYLERIVGPTTSCDIPQFNAGRTLTQLSRR